MTSHVFLVWRLVISKNTVGPQYASICVELAVYCVEPVSCIVGEGSRRFNVPADEHKEKKLWVTSRDDRHQISQQVRISPSWS